MPDRMTDRHPRMATVAWLMRSFQDELTHSDRELLARYLVLRALERMVDADVQGSGDVAPWRRAGRRTATRR